jgi:hypothetical protein
MSLDLAGIQEKQLALAEIKTQLKTEFFGMDSIIDRVVDSLYAWYLFPQLIARPVIVNLWGMTGVGKTQLVRRLANLLGFAEHFVEVQMDGFSSGSGFSSSSISGILGQSSVEEGLPGILLLDEIQRFRTIDEHGADLKLERYQDVWMLLSDGKFSADSTLFREVEDLLTYQMWREDRKDDPDECEDKPKTKRVTKFKIGPYEARNLKRLLRLKEDTAEIMTWDEFQVEKALKNIKSSRTSWELDYSKLLIFISGNLDEAFAGARSTEDSDTNADIYHEMTKRISTSDIKQALACRFRPEQIARMGNNHVIYPSLSKDSYQKLIQATCTKYVTEMEKLSELKINVDPLIYDEIYDNSVYPTQGTRPVFSSIHKIFSSALSSIAVWAIETHATEVNLTIDVVEQKLIGSANGQTKEVQVDLDLRSTRKRNTVDFNTMVAVHEAGHALIYALLLRQAPQEVKINLASFNGGYMIHQNTHGIYTRAQIRNLIAVSLAGTAAEELVFGTDRKSNGCEKDLHKATNLASNYVRRQGFGESQCFVAGEDGVQTSYVADLTKSNESIETLVSQEMKRTQTLLTEHRDALVMIVTALLDKKHLDQKEFVELVGSTLQISLEETEERFSQDWAAWASKAAQKASK